jgi:hypothetical protein
LIAICKIYERIKETEKNKRKKKKKEKDPNRVGPSRPTEASQPVVFLMCVHEQKVSLSMAATSPPSLNIIDLKTYRLKQESYSP